MQALLLKETEDKNARDNEIAAKNIELQQAQAAIAA